MWGLRSLAARHRPLLVVLALGVLLRAATWEAYHPALFFADSWEYLDMARSPWPGFQVDRPSGYGWLLWLFSLGGGHLGVFTAVQHLAGLAIAALAAAMALALGLGRWVAALIAALVALDVAWLAIEQNLMTEAFFGLALVAAVALVLRARAAPWRWGASGALLAACLTMRTAGLFALPAWGLVLLVRRVGWRSAAAAAVGLLVPVMAYATLHAASGRGFGLAQSGGWFEYARTAPIIRCDAGWPREAAQRRLCPTPHELAENWSPGDYLWDADSPANEALPDMYDDATVATTSRELGTLAHQAIERRPGAYVRMVGHDVVGLFDPAAGGTESATELTPPGYREWIDPVVRAHDAPWYTRATRAPQAQLRAYGRVVHTPRRLLGLLALAGVLSLAAAVLPRWRRRAAVTETLLLTGTGVGLVVGTVAGSDLIMRYLLPSGPLIALGGAVAIRDALRYRPYTVRR